MIDKDVYRADREVGKFNSSSFHSLIQLEVTTYVMYNVDLGKHTDCISHLIILLCICTVHDVHDGSYSKKKRAKVNSEYTTDC